MQLTDRQVRQALRVGRSEIAERSKTSRPTVTLYEANPLAVSAAKRQLIADVYNDLRAQLENNQG